MFTGIIEATAQVLDKTPSSLMIERPKSFTDLKIGSSVCVAGVCLSVVKLTKTSMQFDVVEETVQKTRLGSLKKGDQVNLERAMKAGERIDGHIVQGHVEGVATVKSEKRKESSCELSFQIPKDVLSFVVPKGSIAIDGVSLTVADIHDDEVMVALIPHTLKHTTLGAIKQGDLVNIETDVMIRSHHTAILPL